MGMIRRAVDYLIVGGGFSGLNALSALKQNCPRANVLCIDRHLQPGGSWNDYYGFVTLHAPHPTFGVSGHPWHLSDPNVLAPRGIQPCHFLGCFVQESDLNIRVMPLDDVVRHFSSFIDTLPTDFRFQGSTSFIAAEALPGRSEGVSVKLHDDAQGKFYDVDAAAVIDARCRRHATVHLRFDGVHSK